METMMVEQDIVGILEKASNHEPLELKDGIALMESSDLLSIGYVADSLRKEVAGDTVGFVIDRNINYTNVCVSKCKFCAFYRGVGSKDAYVLSMDALLKKAGEAVKMGATQILLQGGLHPELPIEFYEDMLRTLKQRFPDVQRHAFSPPEIDHIARLSGNTIKEVLLRLKDAGLQSIPGGGAEILEDKVRKEISPNKIGWRVWKNVMVEAHKLGIPSTATMVYGLGEGNEERVKHIRRIKEIQEETHGFTAFIPWSFQSGNTRLGREHGIRPDLNGVEYLKLIAVSRLILQDAIRNIQVSWVTQGQKVAQVALSYGANDFGGTMIEENVVRAAGLNSQYLPPETIVRLIKETGRKAVRRGTLYNVLEEF